MKMDDPTEQGTYIAQLREVFDSCDEKETGYLGEDELFSLCFKLQLTEQADVLVRHLLCDHSKTRVDFNEFKEGFIALLTQTVHSENEDDESGNDECDENNLNSSQREISPKFVLGAKKYGRRSRPASIIENDETINADDYIESDVFSSTNNTTTKQNFAESNLKCKLPASVPGTPDLTFKTRKPHLFVKSLSEPVTTGDNFPSLPVTPEHTPPRSHLSRHSSFQSQQGDSETCPTPEDYLGNLWKRLEIGKDGYLNAEELAMVCQHIGMEASPDTVAQLFDKLDCDRDGRVTFGELVQGLFQHGIPDNSNNVKSPVPSEMSFTCSPVNHRVYRHNSQEDMQISEPCMEAGIFSSIDPEGGGYVLSSSIIELWEALGIPCGSQILQDLGFNIKMKINLQDLTLLLEEELNNASSDHVYQIALTTLQHELRHTKTMSSQLQTERDKLKEAVVETNDRAALLAQEIDDHHARLEENSENKILNLEKRYQEQLRELQDELRRERELLSMQMANIKSQLEKELQASQAEEGVLKKELSSQQSDNNRLDKELQELLSRCAEAESRNLQLQKELDSLRDVRQKLSDFESTKNEDKCDNLNLELRELKKQNKDLQDHTVELTLEIDNLKLMLSANSRYSNKRHNRTSSWLADYTKGYTEALNNGSSLKRRGSGSSSDGNSEEETSRMVGKVARRLSLSSGGELIVMESYDMDDMMMDDGGCLSLEGARSRRGSNVGIKLTTCSSYPQLLNASNSSIGSLNDSRQVDELARKLSEEVALRNRAIEEKEQTIAKLNQDYQQMLEIHEKKFGTEVERNSKLQLSIESMRDDIRNTLCNLYELVQSYVPQNCTENAAIIKNKIEEQFSKVLLMIEPNVEAKISNSFYLGSSSEGMLSISEQESEMMPTKMDTLLRDMFVENGRLMTELKVAEEQRVRAEKSNGRLQYKCKVLGKLLKDVTHANLK